MYNEASVREIWHWWCIAMLGGTFIFTYPCLLHPNFHNQEVQRQDKWTELQGHPYRNLVQSLHHLSSSPDATPDVALFITIYNRKHRTRNIDEFVQRKAPLATKGDRGSSNNCHVLHYLGVWCPKILCIKVLHKSDL